MFGLSQFCYVIDQRLLFSENSIVAPGDDTDFDVCPS